jgi:acetolactate synthase-1/2/3 large subunit
MPQDVIRTLYEVTNGEAYICSGRRSSIRCLQPSITSTISRGSGLILAVLGTMGFGLPAAMGVQLAHPDSAVACCYG